MQINLCQSPVKMAFIFRSVLHSSLQTSYLLFTCTILFVSRIYLVPSGRARPRLKLINHFHSSAGSSKVFLPLFLDVHDVITRCYLRLRDMDCLCQEFCHFTFWTPTQQEVFSYSVWCSQLGTFVPFQCHVTVM